MGQGRNRGQLRNGSKPALRLHARHRPKATADSSWLLQTDVFFWVGHSTSQQQELPRFAEVCDCMGSFFNQKYRFWQPDSHATMQIPTLPPAASPNGCISQCLGEYPIATESSTRQQTSSCESEQSCTQPGLASLHHNPQTHEGADACVGCLIADERPGTPFWRKPEL